MDPLIRFATKLMALLAVIPRAYRPPIGGPSPKEGTWGKRLGALLSFDAAWLLATFFAARFLNKKRIKSAIAERLPRNTGINPKPLFSWDQEALLDKACEIAFDAKEEWQIAAAGASMAAAINAIGVDELASIISQLQSGQLANPPPATDEGMRARYNTVLYGSPPPSEVRSSRFDRGDFEVRDQIIAHSVEIRSGREPLPGTATLKADAEVAAAHLRGMGHSDSEIARLLAGPGQDEAATARAHLRGLGYSDADADRLINGPRRT